MSQGRVDEAHAVVAAHLGGDAYFRQEDFGEEQVRPGSFKQLFGRGLRKRTAFVCIFWACLVAPYFAIFTFAPEVLKALSISDPRAATITLNGVAALGALAGMFVIERFGRRKVLIVPFWITASALLVIGLWTHAPGVVIVVAFMVFSFFNAVQGDLTAVYPNEVFPTDVRTTGVGVASAASRVGAATGTFLLPVSLSSIGVGPTMVIAAAICVAGAVVSHAWAPETTGLSLSKATALPSSRVAAQLT
jgi:putative MFS transporter